MIQELNKINELVVCGGAEHCNCRMHRNGGDEWSGMLSYKASPTAKADNPKTIGECVEMCCLGKNDYYYGQRFIIAWAWLQPGAGSGAGELPYAGLYGNGILSAGKCP